MKKAIKLSNLLTIYICAAFLLILIAHGTSKTVTVISENVPMSNRRCIIIDAGHGGVDTGATSYTGHFESHINLEIALRLEKLFQLLGFETSMIRNEDISIHTQGTTIAQKKVSDLKRRVGIVNEAKNSVLISIHQNYFSESQYYGPQVFYANNKESATLASRMQQELICTLCPNSNRKAKQANGIYLMEKINTTGILIECGFLSNPTEEGKLINAAYQKKLCCVIAATYSNYINDKMIA